MSGRILAVGAIILRADGRILLVLRRNNPQAGCWTVPGGKVESGESLQEATRREVREETGLHVRPIREAWVVDVPDGAGNFFEVHDFDAELESGVLAAGDDAVEVRWFSSAEMDAVPVISGLTDLLRRHGYL